VDISLLATKAPSSAPIGAWENLVLTLGSEPSTARTPQPAGTPQPVGTPQPASTPQPAGTSQPVGTSQPASTPQPARALQPPDFFDLDAAAKLLSSRHVPADTSALSETACPFDAHAAMKVLSAKIQAATGRNIIQVFKSCASRPVHFGCMHCEAVLASLVHYEGADVDATIKYLAEFKDSKYKTIGVSKLCCPVCWHLLTILRGSTKDYEVRGHHGNIYSVDLPFWLPDDVKQTLIDQFRSYLMTELVTMMEQEARRMKSFTPTHTRQT